MPFSPFAPLTNRVSACGQNIAGDGARLIEVWPVEKSLVNVDVGARADESGGFPTAALHPHGLRARETANDFDDLILDRVGFLVRVCHPVV